MDWSRLRCQAIGQEAIGTNWCTWSTTSVWGIGPLLCRWLEQIIGSSCGVTGVIQEQSACDDAAQCPLRRSCLSKHVELLWSLLTWPTLWFWGLSSPRWQDQLFCISSYESCSCFMMILVVFHWTLSHLCIDVFYCGAQNSTQHLRYDLTNA